MSREKLLCIMFIVMQLDSLCCLEPVSTSAVIGGLALSASYAGYSYVKCQYFECCEDPWIRLDTTGLDGALMLKLHGQHLAHSMITKSILAHVTKKKPSKALVMAFHGWTGSGKNFASKMIVENLYKNGMKSSFVHLYISTNDFPHASEVQKYKDKLLTEIPAYTKYCGRSVFIFDEIDKMPPGVIDALKPFIDYHENVGGVDYRRNIYIFLSNTGGIEINQIAYQFWVEGEERERITMKDIEPLIARGAFNENGGLQHSDIIGKHLIDIYVPFLPLEKEHIRKCVEDELNSRSATFSKKLVEDIANQLQYWPTEFKIYSKSGCKKVSHKVDLYGDVD